jgi:hypothetical protein
MNYISFFTALWKETLGALNLTKPFDPLTLLLRIQPLEINKQKEGKKVICTKLFIADLLVVSKE